MLGLNFNTTVEHDGPVLFPRTARKGEAFVLWPMIPGALHTLATRGVRWPLKNMLSEMRTTQLVAQGTLGNPGGRTSSPHPDTSEYHGNSRVQSTYNEGKQQYDKSIELDPQWYNNFTVLDTQWYHNSTALFPQPLSFYRAGPCMTQSFYSAGPSRVQPC